MRFTYDGRVIEGFDHPYNTTIKNERAVEIGVAIDWLGRRRGEGLEVGNVLSHYEIGGHRVVDLEEGPEFLDVFAITGEYDWIISISTVEHVQWADGTGTPGESLRAIKHLQSLLKPGGAMLVTAPMGWNTSLDQSLIDGETGARSAIMMQRRGSSWRQAKFVREMPYGATQPWAEAVWIGQFDAIEVPE